MNRCYLLMIPLSAAALCACSQVSTAQRDGPGAAGKYLASACRAVLSDRSMEVCEVRPESGRPRVFTFGAGIVPALRKAAAAAGLPEETVEELPATGPGGPSWGIVRVPVATLHSGPGYGEPLSTQALLGTPMRLLERRGWWRVQLPDGYIAWIPSGQVTAVSEKELARRNSSSLLFISALETPARELPDAGSREVVLLPGGAIVEELQEKTDGLVRTRLPDGRTGWIDASAASPLPPSGDGEPVWAVMREALRLSGRSYTWAGTSPWGLDCSGFVHAAFGSAGYVIPRDAWQQERIGKPLPAEEKLRAGDILLFGEDGRIGHIGISLGGPRFIHSLADVHESSLSETDADFDPQQKERFLRAVRPDFTDGRCIRKLAGHPFLKSPPEPLDPCLKRAGIP